MTRFALLAFLIACDPGRRANDPQPAPPRTGLVLDPEGLPSGAEVIPVPGGTPVDADSVAEPAPIPPAPKLGSIPGPARPIEGGARTGGANKGAGSDASAGSATTSAAGSAANSAAGSAANSAATNPAGASANNAAGSAADPHPLSDVMREHAKDATNHLRPEEGMLTVSRVDVAHTQHGIAQIKITPAAGWHVSMEYPTKLWLEAPTAVALSKSYFTAGGRSKKGDASALSEQALVFDVKLTVAAEGAYDVTGVLVFGICEADSCHPKTQPITIRVTGK